MKTDILKVVSRFFVAHSLQREPQLTKHRAHAEASELRLAKLCRLTFSLFSLMLLSIASLAAVRPNIVVFLVDDLGSGELECYASRFHETPNIDALAAEGCVSLTHIQGQRFACRVGRLF